jgi:hypothetical protein
VCIVICIISVAAYEAIPSDPDHLLDCWHCGKCSVFSLSAC